MYDKISDSNSKPTIITAPYAGGSSQSYMAWGMLLKNHCDVLNIDYSGHGRRYKGALANDFYELAGDLKHQIFKIMEYQSTSMPDKSCILFGHSMGALAMAYIAESVYSKYGDLMKGIILSSCRAPDIFSNKNRSVKSDQKLIDYLCVERNIPVEIVKSNEFLEVLFPAIKNDFRLIDEFQFRPLKLPPCQVHCIWGEQDYGINDQTMSGWQKYTDMNIIWHSIQGTHFYFEENIELFIEQMKKIIQQCMKG